MIAAFWASPDVRPSVRGVAKDSRRKSGRRVTKRAQERGTGAQGRRQAAYAYLSTESRAVVSGRVTSRGQQANFEQQAVTVSARRKLPMRLVTSTTGARGSNALEETGF